ncbi:hypothetical protein DFH06DRAFT_1291172 [Mycena polygramma]|nr:hypothetical protein DFH06DRAFT_1291172 [Mycena polygramma]
MQARQPALDDSDTQIALRRYIADYSSLLAPIRLLPVDILQMIFLHPDMHDLEQMGPQVVTEYDTEGITAVCHHWRDVALGIPQLWSSFQVSLGHGRYSSLEWIRLRLERSKSAPLSVRFHHWRPVRKVDPADQPRHVKSVEEIVGELVGHAERWCHIALPSSSEFLSFLAPALNRLLGLQTIVFLDGPDQHSRECDVFANTPRLRTLGLRQEEHAAKFPPLPWAQLTHASIPPSHYTPLSIFAVASELQEIILRTSVSLDPWFRPPTSRLTLSVQKTVLSGPGAQSFLMMILNYADTPRLKELFLVKCGAWDSPRIPELMQSSGCRPEALVLQDTRIRARDLLTLLSAIPTLETLVLTDNIPNTVTNILLQALTPAPGQPALLPQLCTFILTGSYLFSTDTLLLMLESRTGSQNQFSALTTIDITLSDRGFSPAELERFAVLRGVESSCLDFEQGETAGRFTFGYTYDRDWEYDEGSLLR